MCIDASEALLLHSDTALPDWAEKPAQIYRSVEKVISKAAASSAIRIKERRVALVRSCTQLCRAR